LCVSRYRMKISELATVIIAAHVGTVNHENNVYKSVGTKASTSEMREKRTSLSSCVMLFMS